MLCVVRSDTLNRQGYVFLPDGFFYQASRGSEGDCTMKETQWLESTDPMPMLKFLGPSDKSVPRHRKWRLFACACCRRIWHLLPDESSRELVVAVENQPDGSFDDVVLHDDRHWKSCPAVTGRQKPRNGKGPDHIQPFTST